jgi:hypothetical protein
MMLQYSIFSYNSNYLYTYVGLLGKRGTISLSQLRKVFFWQNVN